MPETCPRRIVGESARTRLRDFRGELDLWTERGPVSFVPRSFQAMGKLRCVMGEGRRGGEEERYVDEVRRLSVGYKLVGLYTDWRVYNHRQQCVGWSLVFFRRINGLFHIGEEREGGEAGWSLSKKIFYACETTQCSFFVSIILMAVKRTKLGLKSEIPASVKMIQM